MVVQEKEPITAAASIAHFLDVRTRVNIGLVKLTAMDMKCSSVSFLSRHKATAYSNLDDRGCSEAIEAIF
jgi:hypothetical protein